MKRLLIGFLILLFVALACIYIFIPADIKVSKIIVINNSSDAAYRFLTNSDNWKKWWPKNNAADTTYSNHFIYSNTSYKINGLQHNGFEIAISRGESNINSNLYVLPFNSDSAAIEWKCNIFSGNSPIAKVQKYFEAVAIKKNMNVILGSLHSFLQDKENIYGVRIDRTSTKDTFLLATKTVVTHYPTVADVYVLIDQLQQHINMQSAKQTNPAIMNITIVDSNNYQLMVAVPIDKKLPDAGNLFFKRMVPGYFLVTEVKGGNYAVDNTLNAVHLYIKENRKISMAIPFQSLITDRRREPDTSKWITRIYYPVVR
jgi:hypothetical protein